jgi:hypothetical protein
VDVETSGGLAAGGVGVWGMAPADLDHAGLAIADRAMFHTRSGVLTIATTATKVACFVLN